MELEHGIPNASTPQRRVLGPSWAWAVKTIRSRFPTSQPASRSGMAWCAPPPRTAFRHFALARISPKRRCDAEGDPLLPLRSAHSLATSRIPSPRRDPPPPSTTDDAGVQARLRHGREERAGGASRQDVLVAGDAAAGVVGDAQRGHRALALRAGGGEPAAERGRAEAAAARRAGARRGGDGPATDRSARSCRGAGASRRALQFPRVAERSRGTGTSRTARRCPWRRRSRCASTRCSRPRWWHPHPVVARVQLRRRRKRPRRRSVNDTVARWSGSRRDAW